MNNSQPPNYTNLHTNLHTYAQDSQFSFVFTGVPYGAQQSSQKILREGQVEMFNSVLSNTTFIPRFNNHQDNLNQMKVFGQLQENFIRQNCEKIYADIEVKIMSQKEAQEIGIFQSKVDQQKGLSDQPEKPDAQHQSRERVQEPNRHQQMDTINQIRNSGLAAWQIEEYQEVSLLDIIYDDQSQNQNQKI